MTNKIPAIRPSWLPYLLILCFSISALTTVAQDKGDEDKTMANSVKTRDQKAIDKAMQSWWPASMKTRNSRLTWWRDARFGIFIHWGIYSLPAGEWEGKNIGGYAEHLMRKAKIPRSTYLELAHHFDPTKFNADKWVQAAKYAGMRYLIITAKHHDGFAMYNSQVSDYNVVKQTAWKHDPMVDLAAACKKYGIKFGFYYSHAFDWEHPDAPGNDWDYQNPGGDLNLFGGRDWYDLHPELLPKAVNYVDKKAIPQIKELITKYHPDILWFDTPQKLPLSENIRILKAIRETDPNIIVNGRLARGSGNLQLGDYKNTADRPAEFFPVIGDWEAIPTTNESYGYSKFDKSHKPVSFFIRLLAKATSRGGNLLMNIGPMGDGEFAPEDTAILQGIGRWMSKNSASIYQTTKTALPYQSWGVSTRKNNLLYLHVFNWPKNGQLIVGGLKSGISKAWVLADKKELKFSRLDPLDVAIHLPAQAPDTSNTVIVLETTTGKIETDTVRLLASRETTNRLLAFDARLEGKGFGFGDGKTSSYYVEGWKNTNQSVNWDLRLIEPATYKILLKYAADNVDEGTYELSIGNHKVKGSVEAIAKGVQVKEQELGTVSLEPGAHSLSITPVEIKKAGLMKLLEIQLIPVSTP